MNLTYSVSEVIEELTSSYKGAIKRRKAPRPYILFGSPGVGKTQAVMEVARKVGAEVKVILAACVDPVDIIGFPEKVNETYAHYLPFKWAYDVTSQDGDPTILFFDDLLLADPKVQGAFFRVCLERYIGDRKIRDDVFIVAASNRESDNAGASEMNKALENRFRKLTVEVSSDDWIQWAESNQIHPYVVAYIQTHRNHLNNFNPDSDEASATPRSWENVSDYLWERDIQTGTDLPKKAIVPLTGMIGGIASGFCKWIRTAKGAVDPKVIIKDPKNAPIPEEKDIDILYTTVYGLSSFIQEDPDANKIVSGFIYGNRLPEEFGFILMKQISSKVFELPSDQREKVLEHEVIETSIEKFGKILPINFNV